MAEPTPRFGLDIFEAGDEEWDHTDTVEFVDEYAIDRGELADRPTEGEYDGEFYFAVDEATLYHWDADAGEWAVAFGRGAGLEYENTDLSTVTGSTPGVSRATDDGTNTPSGHAELCLWVDRDGDGDMAWQIVGTETYIKVN